MPIEMGLWRIDGDQPRRLPARSLPSEEMLESFLAHDPSLLGVQLLVIGRQVRTPYGKYLDLLAVDEDGTLHVLELKRDRTPREVVAQLLDYGSWVTTLSREEVMDLAEQHLQRPFEEAFAETFTGTLPDEINAELRMTVVAGELDPSSERIVTYLRDFGVPINAVFFSYLEDEDRRYLARSWLATREEGPTAPAGPRRGKRAEWNGIDWFVAFGEESGSRDWEDARRWGFVSAGGDPWYSRTLRAVPIGARINVHIPKVGYVGIGTVVGEPMRFDRAVFEVDGSPVALSRAGLEGRYHHGGPETFQDDEVAEWVLPVEWTIAVPREDAYWTKGMFANQNSACKLRQEYTLERLAEHFGVSAAD